MPTKTKKNQDEREFEKNFAEAKRIMEPFVLKYMKKIRKLLLQKKWNCEEIYENMMSNDYRWELDMVSPTGVHHKFVVAMLDARQWDGECGTTFNIKAEYLSAPNAYNDDPEWVQYVDVSLHNYTPQVWVDPANIRALETRFRETAYGVCGTENLVEHMEKQPDAKAR